MQSLSTVVCRPMVTSGQPTEKIKKLKLLKYITTTNNTLSLLSTQPWVGLFHEITYFLYPSQS